VSGQPFFLTVAGISLSLAGFAGLLASFRQPSGSWSRVDLWRLKRIVNRSFVVLALALVPIPLFAIVSDEALTVRVVSVLLAALVLLDLVRITPGWRRDWPNDRGLLFAWTLNGGFAALALANGLWASVGVYELELGAMLFWPASIFIRVLEDLRAEAG
jgi:hypothetical protein